MNLISYVFGIEIRCTGVSKRIGMEQHSGHRVNKARDNKLKVQIYFVYFGTIF